VVILYLVVEKLETPTSGKEAIVKEAIHPTATILTVVDKRRRLYKFCLFYQVCYIFMKNTNLVRLIAYVMVYHRSLVITTNVNTDNSVAKTVRKPAT